MNRTIITKYLLWGATRGIAVLKLAIFARLVLPSTLGQWFAIVAAMAVPAGLARIGSREFILRLSGDKLADFYDSAFTAEVFASTVSALFSLLLWAPILHLSGLLDTPTEILAGFTYLNFANVIVFPTVKNESSGSLHRPQIPLLASEVCGLLISVFLLTATSLQMGALIAGGIIGMTAGLLVSMGTSQKRPQLTWNPLQLREILRFGTPISLYTTLSTLSTSIIMVGLAHFNGPASSAKYGLIISISSLVSAPLAVLESSYYVSFASASGNRPLLIRLLTESSLVFSLIGGSLGALLIFNGDVIVKIIAGSKWTDLVPLVELLGIQVTIRLSTVYLYGHLAYSENQTAQMLRWAIQDLVLASTLGLWLVFNYAEIGAVIYLAAQALIMIPLVRIPTLKKALGSVRELLPCLVPVVAWGVLAAIFHAMSWSGPLTTIIFVALFTITVFTVSPTARRVLRDRMYA